MLSSTLYTKFPVVSYNDNLATNITVRLKFTDIVKKNDAVYYPYTIQEGERPETLAFKYYDDVNYAWLIFLANDIYDPTFDWPLADNLFAEYIVNKYGSISNAQQQIAYYSVDWLGDDSLITQSAYTSLPTVNKKYWAPVIGTDNAVMGYQRAQVDWAMDTNKIVRLQIDTANTLVQGDVLFQSTTGNIDAKAIVDYSDSSYIYVKHVQGTFTQDKSVYLKRNDVDTLYGTCTSAIVTSANLQPEEENYWNYTTSYDYELMVNESKKHIRLIDKMYVDLIEKDVRELLAQ